MPPVAPPADPGLLVMSALSEADPSDPSDAPVFAAGLALGRALAAVGAWVTTAESCTGGLIARALTETAGSSAWFDRGVVTYSNASKVALLGVSPQTLADHGAVSEPVAAQMAEGALRTLAPAESALSLAVTGIAGPGGAVPGKPVGTVCFGWALSAPLRQVSAAEGALAVTRTVHFEGDRAAVRRQAAQFALEHALRLFRQCLVDRPPTA
jgi:nicotinamide-nucleotide amidase